MQQAGTKKEVVIVDLADANNIIRRPISAESAIMHPTDKILALRGEKRRLSTKPDPVADYSFGTPAQRQLQIFNMYGQI